MREPCGWAQPTEAGADRAGSAGERRPATRLQRQTASATTPVQPVLTAAVMPLARIARGLADRSVLLVAFADFGRDRTCKKPKGQSLFFLVEHGYPEMLPTLGAEELRNLLEDTML